MVPLPETRQLNNEKFTRRKVGSVKLQFSLSINIDTKPFRLWFGLITSQKIKTLCFTTLTLFRTAKSIAFCCLNEFDSRRASILVKWKRGSKVKWCIGSFLVLFMSVLVACTCQFFVLNLCYKRASLTSHCVCVQVKTTRIFSTRVPNYRCIVLDSFWI